MRYTVTALLNVGEHNFDGYEEGQPLATADDLTFTVEATDHFHAAEEMFRVGQKMGTDAEGHTYPLDVRSFSVGDVVKATAEGANAITRYLACISVGFRMVTGTPSNLVDLAGTHHTSRTKDTGLRTYGPHGPY